MTTGRGEGDLLAVRGPARHVPVLLREVLAALHLRAGGRYLDATFGAGGYSAAFLEAADAQVLALDRDPSAIAGGAALVAASNGRLLLVEARFSDLYEAAKAKDFLPLDGVAFDIGVSSMQFDQEARGFSFRFDGPLDMRMEMRGRSAADIVNEEDEAVLADILYYFGEERASRRIARAIVAARAESRIDSTRALAAIIARAAPAKPTDIHPATKSFQALRIAVNDELGQLLAGLSAAERALAEGGRLAVVTFHSLEDRIVKLFLTERGGRGETGSRRLPGEAEPPAATFRVEGRQPVTPTEAETAANPRARSAKLRFATRTAAPARAGGDSRLSALASLPERGKGRS